MNTYTVANTEALSHYDYQNMTTASYIYRTTFTYLAHGLLYYDNAHTK